MEEVTRKNNEITLELENLEGENNKIDKLNEEIKNRIKKDQERLSIQKLEQEEHEHKQRKINSEIMHRSKNIMELQAQKKDLMERIKKLKWG